MVASTYEDAAQLGKQMQAKKRVCNFYDRPRVAAYALGASPFGPLWSTFIRYFYLRCGSMSLAYSCHKEKTDEIGQRLIKVKNQDVTPFLFPRVCAVPFRYFPLMEKNLKAQKDV
jgi:hypothetical protein